MEKQEVNTKEIEKEFIAGLENAERNQEETGRGGFENVAPLKPKCVLPTTGVRLLCDFKNNLKIKALSKDADELTKAVIERRLRTSDKEVTLYKNALELTGDKYAPPEWIEFLDKYANSPVALIVEHEVESFLALRAELKELKQQEENTRKAA